MSTFLLETEPGFTPIPRDQGFDAAMGHLEIEAALVSRSLWDSGFQPVLEWPHIKQA